MIRPAVFADLEALMPIVEAMHIVEKLGWDEPAVRRDLGRLLRDDRLGQVLVAEMDGGIRGYLILAYGFSIEYRGRDAFVDELFVADGWRGRRIGTALLDQAKEVCRCQGIQALHLEVDRDNTRARALYERMGFGAHPRDLMTLWM